MMRLLPDTVVGRTALVLVAALTLALGATLALMTAQRHEALSALGGRNAAERVASIARLLEDTAPELRRQALHRMETPGFRAVWTPAPLVVEDENEGMAAAVRKQLDQGLEGRTVLVSTRPGPAPGHHMARGEGMKHRPALRISVRLEDGSWLNVQAPLEQGDALRPELMVPLVLALVAVIGVALWAVGLAARPFAAFAAAAERLGVDVTAPPMAETGPREVRQAAHAFNVMQDRIRRFVQDRTQMLAAISHDLRTPLTRMRLRAEFIEDDDERARMLADLDEMERMIAATLAFARDDAAREQRRPVDVAALLGALVEDQRAMGRDAAYDGPDTLELPARPMALKRALVNLLDNAVKYGTRARVRLEAHDGQAEIVVEDDGPGIPEDDRERVFAPFVRLEGSRNRDTGGTGLGLAVARAAIRAHGGDIHLSQADSGGLRARIILPATA